ncbi:hypothetical protein [Microbacterium candidum]|uniref:TrbL/VirB6 plasmid conjugal transfer protein n=1 Tax=Microbacterium candidum TaxID=3041922 RepID=A0ABT7MVY7_9MICO|nr:hypothetical protein [Microbacterium sp. ASV49]MDL9978621.1 hypothetical protein [Microbacterium sp. ASV49]
MRAARLFTIGCLVGIGLAMSALAPAQAAGPSSQPPPAGAASVTGQPWSSPAYPVDCHQVGNQISCTPQNTADVKAQQCFIDVFIAGSKATLCTTYEGHVGAIKLSGGKPLLVQYGCQVADVVCLTFENAGRGMALSATSMMSVVAQNMRFDTSSLLWNAAEHEWSFWQWAILAVLFISMVWAITAAIVSGDRAELVAAFVRSFIAFPATAATLWLSGKLLNAIDDLTWYVMNRDGKDALFATLQSVMWAGGQANYFFAFVIHGLLMIAMVLLMLVFAFRNIVLAALFAVGPIAWMLYPVRSVGPQWVVRYFSAVAVLLLTGPLTIGFLTLIINGLATVKTIWDPQSWPLLIGLVLVAFAPFAVFGLFSFVGAVAADSVGSRIGSGARSTATSAARTAGHIPSRIGALPAGKSGATAAAGKSGPSSGGPPRGPSSPSGPSTTSGPPRPSSPTSTAKSPTPPTNTPATKASTGTPPPPRTERTA